MKDQVGMYVAGTLKGTIGKVVISGFGRSLVQMINPKIYKDDSS